MNLTPNHSQMRLLNVKRTPLLITNGRERFPEPTVFIEKIHIRAETVTRVLKEIPGYRPPLRWGINE